MEKYNGEPLYIYGTGPAAKGVYSDLTAKGYKVIGFIDHLDRLVPPMPVFKLQDVQDQDKAVVILAVLNPSADTLSIAKSLVQFKKIVSIVHFYDYFSISSNESNMHFWLTDRKYYIDWHLDIAKAAKLWKDTKSQELFYDIVDYRMDGDPLMCPQPQNHIYHPRDIPNWKDPMRLIDCGAFDGDTIRELSSEYNIERCAAFEPDPEPFFRLIQYEKECGLKIEYCNVGIYSKAAIMPFIARGDQSSEIITDKKKASSFIHCVPLDIFIDFAPTLIKMDIEGSEMDALNGAQRMIGKYHPGLAISVYHKPWDMWQIPLWVNGHFPEVYDFYLRVHAQATFDTVMYAVPK